MVEWNRHRIERPYRAGEGGKANHAGLSATLLRLIREEPLHDRTILDVGCGSGRLTLTLAKEVGRIIGIDRANEVIEQARQHAAALRLDHVTFHCLDAEVIDYRDLGPISLVVANLCMSDEILRRAAAVLSPGDAIAFAAFHVDQWKESGRISQYAYGEGHVETALSEAGFEPVYLGVEREVLSFAAPDEGLTYLEGSGLSAKWKADGRRQGFVTYLQGSGREFTVRARVIIKARRR
ncbi:MAG: class I SAM-dependent methyltransferase [candidate division NC10 bacterium]|nr:class I SAM-dependent methyltransferase [candidate division NC10 bacterium]